MQKYGVNELRRMFLEFFESKGHLVMKSFSLVPHNDNSLLLINSGMAPLKPYFTGQEIPPRRRVATCQKCIRTGDIENIGKTARHGTFFEMLGNFSFGDYFKDEAIHWSWEFLTEVVGLDPDRLYPSVYLDDDEAFDIWNKEIGIPAERIFRFGKEDNFWEHGAGPCGPCSEIYYDRGEKYGCGKPTCTVGCDCDRYIEVWNNVFSQFENDGHGHYTELKQKNIDTGMGLERLAVVVQDVDSLFTVDTNKALLDAVCALAHTQYLADEKKDVSLRIIADHVKSCTFMISDGIMPSNEGRGYVLRRLLRRAARHGRMLGIEGRFMAGLAKEVIELSKDGYPELEEKQADLAARREELSLLGNCEAEYNRLLEARARELRQDPQSPTARRLLALEEWQAQLTARSKELQEAIQAGYDALSDISSIESALSSAEGWGTWDVFGGGLISDLAKYSHLDDAQQQINGLQRSLSRFRTELADVDIRTGIQVEVDSFLRFADYFFDNIFTDWAVLDRIRRTQSLIHEVDGSVRTILYRLERDLDQCQRDSEAVRQELKDFLVNA